MSTVICYYGGGCTRLKPFPRVINFFFHIHTPVECPDSSAFEDLRRLSLPDRRCVLRVFAYLQSTDLWLEWKIYFGTQPLAIFCPWSFFTIIFHGVLRGPHQVVICCFLIFSCLALPIVIAAAMCSICFAFDTFLDKISAPNWTDLSVFDFLIKDFYSRQKYIFHFTAKNIP